MGAGPSGQARSQPLPGRLQAQSGVRSGPRCEAPRGEDARPGLVSTAARRRARTSSPARTPSRTPRLPGALAGRPGSPSSALTFLLPAVGRHGCPPASAAATAGTRVARAPQPRPQAHESVRQSVRPAGRALRPDLRHSAPYALPASRPLLLLLPAFRAGLGRPGLQPSSWDSATTATRGRGEEQMATAGGAKMEPASLLKQSRSRNALRCLRSVPRANVTAPRRAGEAGRPGRGLGPSGGVASTRRPAPRCLTVQRPSLLPGAERHVICGLCCCASYTQGCRSPS